MFGTSHSEQAAFNSLHNFSPTTCSSLWAPVIVLFGFLVLLCVSCLFQSFIYELFMIFMSLFLFFFLFFNGCWRPCVSNCGFHFLPLPPNITNASFFFICISRLSVFVVLYMHFPSVLCSPLVFLYQCFLILSWQFHMGFLLPVTSFKYLLC